jgi:hypothetical protein
MEPVEFASTPITTERGHVRLPLPVDPRERRGRKPRHHVEGTITGTPSAGSVGFAGGTAFLVLSAGFRAKAGNAGGDEVAVSITPQAARPAD